MSDQYRLFTVCLYGALKNNKNQKELKNLKNRLKLTPPLHIWKCCKNLATQLFALSSDVLCFSYGCISVPRAAEARAACRAAKLLPQESHLPGWAGRAQSKPKEAAPHGGHL